MSDAPADTVTTPTTEAPQTPPEAPETPATDAPDDLAAEVEKWQKLARKHEDRAKANATAAKELERIQREALPEQERLVAEAKAAARAELISEFGAERVESAVRLAVGDRTDVDALLEGLDRNRFLTEDGKADVAAITAWVDRIAPKPTETAATPWPDLGQGAVSSQTPLGSDPLLAHLTAMVGPPRG